MILLTYADSLQQYHTWKKMHLFTEKGCKAREYKVPEIEQPCLTFLCTLKRTTQTTFNLKYSQDHCTQTVLTSKTSSPIMGTDSLQCVLLLQLCIIPFRDLQRTFVERQPLLWLNSDL